MALPSDATKVYLDSSSDDPKQARVELVALIDKFNQLKAELGSLAVLDAGAGVVISGSSLSIEIESADSVTIDCGGL